MNRQFVYPSRSRGTTVWGIVYTVLCIASLVVWQFPDKLGVGDSLRGFGPGWWALCFGVSSLKYAAEWFRPTVRECWIRDGIFGWRSPRQPNAFGEVELSEVQVLRVSLMEHFQLLTAHDRHKVPIGCVRDMQIITDLIAGAYPHIRVEWSVR